MLHVVYESLKKSYACIYTKTKMLHTITNDIWANDIIHY